MMIYQLFPGLFVLVCLLILLSVVPFIYACLLYNTLLLAYIWQLTSQVCIMKAEALAGIIQAQPLLAFLQSSF